MIENYDTIEEINNREIDLKSIYAKTFLWMFLGLLATGIISVFTYTQVLNKSEFLKEIGSVLPVIMIVEVVVVLIFSLLFRKLSPTVVAVLYFVYAALNGITLSSIFFAFELGSIVTIFFVSCAVYAIFALVGMYAKIDLSKIGTICLIGLLACVIISIVNLFLGVSSIFYYIIDYIVLLLFFGVTAYDMQKIKMYAMQGILPEEKIHIYGAMELYLDCINIFLRILRLFGKRK